MRYSIIITTLSLLSLVNFSPTLWATAEESTVPAIELPTVTQHPALACDCLELARLREAYHSAGAEQRVVGALVALADRAIQSPVIFPPRGGQHNQWYQCDYLVVFDDLQSEVRHRYDWVYHHRASGVACDVADKPIERLDPELSGQEYLQHLQQGQTDQPIRVRFSDGEGDTLLLVARGEVADVVTLDPQGNTRLNVDGKEVSWPVE